MAGTIDIAGTRYQEHLQGFALATSLFYGVPILLGALALSAGLVLASIPSLGGFNSPTPGAVMFMAGLLVATFFLALSLRPHRMRRRRGARRDEASRDQEPTLSDEIEEDQPWDEQPEQ
ncbi:MAG: hypothetical protein C1O27_001842 [Chloroflexi bacterium]|nr:MAG: hypothetical protein C1O27_001842 [Chloroflexota bacterium]